MILSNTFFQKYILQNQVLQSNKKIQHHIMFLYLRNSETTSKLNFFRYY